MDSAVVKIDVYEHCPYHIESKENFFRMIRAAFGMRRKTLVNTLSGEFSLSKQAVSGILTECGFPADVRGERLSAQDFALVENKISKIK